MLVKAEDGLEGVGVEGEVVGVAGGDLDPNSSPQAHPGRARALLQGRRGHCCRWLVGLGLDREEKRTTKMEEQRARGELINWGCWSFPLLLSEGNEMVFVCRLQRAYGISLSLSVSVSKEGGKTMKTDGEVAWHVSCCSESAWSLVPSIFKSYAHTHLCN